MANKLTGGDLFTAGVGAGDYRLESNTVSYSIGGDAIKSDEVLLLRDDLKVSLDQQLANLNSLTLPARLDADPVYRIPSDQFGTIAHIDPFHDAFSRARKGLSSLREEVTDGPDSLFRRLADYIEGLYGREFPGADKQTAWRETLDSYFGEFVADGSFTLDKIQDTPLPVVDGSEEASDDAKASQALLKTGKAIRNDIRVLQQLRSRVAAFQKHQQRRLKRLRSELAEVEAAIPPAQKKLANLDRERLSALGDYQVARALVRENWQKVRAQYAERERLLNNHRGLYYARVRETPVSRHPDTSLPLRFSRPDDLVPGCPLEDRDLPEALEPFMESVLDIRIADWQALRGRLALLPDRQRLRKWLARRQLHSRERVQRLQPAIAAPLAARLVRLDSQNRALVRQMASRGMATAVSLVGYQRSAAGVLSLEDLLSGPPHRLRGDAESLRNKLDQAGHCLLTQLRRVAPSIRLDWAEGAERDTLDVAEPASWPGLERARARDLNGIRTLMELVAWWFRQLAGNADSSSYTAVRNLIRASLLVAAADDPESVLHGHLQTVPPVLKAGEALRVHLNREALPGTLLQMVDEQNHLVGTLRVDDFDEQGAVTTVTQLHGQPVTPSTRFTVSGLARPAQPRR